MADLVERLRKGCACGKCRMDLCCCDTMDEAADEIARLREALGMAKDLLDCIVQTPGNTWYVSADDPEAAVCDTYSAIDAVLQHKEPQG